MRVLRPLGNKSFATDLRGLTRIGSPLVRLFRRGRSIHSVYSYWPWRQIGQRLKLSRVLAAQRSFHEVHPDGKRGAGSAFLGFERFLFLVSDPSSGGHRGRKSDEPGIGEIVGRAGLAR